MKGVTLLHFHHVEVLGGKEAGTWVNIETETLDAKIATYRILHGLLLMDLELVGQVPGSGIRLTLAV